MDHKDALKIILNNVPRLTAERISIEDAIGYVLAEDVYSEMDMPPFNKSAVDGYALMSNVVRKAPAELKCVGLIQAGKSFEGKIKSGECVKIMTGASLPEGADSVVMVEETIVSDNFVKIKSPVHKWQNVCLMGEDIQKGKKILEKNRVISAQCISLLATVGRHLVKVIRKPKVTILNTGGEIVPSGRKLSRYQIYNSNGPQLASLLKSDGIVPRCLGIVRDNPEELLRAVREGLIGDIFLISGGVSAGDYDLVPSILKRAGVKEIFHTVNIKPGKPLFFGKKAKTLVFGIPGNPVSNFSTYQIFIKPTICKMSGYNLCWPKFEKGIIEKPFRQKTGRTHFVLATAKNKNGNWYVNPVVCHGSADVFALANSNCFIVVSKNTDCLKAKSEVEILLWKEKLII